MSKTVKSLNRFLVSCLLTTTMMTPALSQSVDRSDIRLRSIDNLSTADAQRNQLLGQPIRTTNQAQTQAQAQAQAPQPAPRPQIDITTTRAPQQRALPVAQATPVVNPDDIDQSTLGNIAADPVQRGTPAVVEPDPFAPTSLRLGTFDVNISLEQAIGYSSNVSQQAGGEGGAFSDTNLNASITSNWSRHQLQTNINGSYRRPFDDDEVDQPQLLIDTSLRLDLIDGYTVTTRGFYNLSTQGFTSSTLAPGAVDNPIQENYGASIELQRTDRKLQLTIRGDVDRDVLDDADLGGGITQNEDDRNNNEYRITTRAGYEISPALTPFVEGAYAIREFDNTLDRNGNRRDSNLFEISGGVEVDLGEKLTGEIAVGYVSESFDDSNLEDLSAVTVNGQLNWSPERDTQVGLTLGTQTNNSITANENGSIIYNGRIDVDRQISDRLSINGFADAQVETNDDNNTTLQLGVGSQYWVNRFMAITSQVDYQRFTTDAPNSSFDATSGQVGIRLQR